MRVRNLFATTHLDANIKFIFLAFQTLERRGYFGAHEKSVHKTASPFAKC